MILKNAADLPVGPLIEPSLPRHTSVPGIANRLYKSYLENFRINTQDALKG